MEVERQEGRADSAALLLAVREFSLRRLYEIAAMRRTGLTAPVGHDEDTGFRPWFGPVDGET